MKIHPTLFALLLLCALAGAFAVGRLFQQPHTAAAAAPAVLQNVPSQLIPTIPSQTAEIKTAKETLRIEGSATILPSSSTSK